MYGRAEHTDAPAGIKTCDIKGCTNVVQVNVHGIWFCVAHGQQLGYVRKVGA